MATAINGVPSVKIEANVKLPNHRFTVKIPIEISECQALDEAVLRAEEIIRRHKTCSERSPEAWLELIKIKVKDPRYQKWCACLAWWDFDSTYSSLYEWAVQENPQCKGLDTKELLPCLDALGYPNPSGRIETKTQHLLPDPPKDLLKVDRVGRISFDAKGWAPGSGGHTQNHPQQTTI